MNIYFEEGTEQSIGIGDLIRSKEDDNLYLLTKDETGDGDYYYLLLHITTNEVTLGYDHLDFIEQDFELVAKAKNLQLRILNHEI